ncbi:MAG TPA: type II secretion system protein [Woeseiaceae bacterium]
MRRRHGQRGFTLVELVTTLTISVIVVGFVALFVSGPVRGFDDQVRRAHLVDAASSALSRLERDVHRALPNSVRVTGAAGIVALELLGTVDGARYRAEPPGGPDTRLRFSAPDDAFDALGAFTQVAKPFSGTSYYLSIYNVGVPGADAYELANVITPPGTQIEIQAGGAAGVDRVTLSPAFRFAYASPTQRVFLIDGPVTWLCDPGAGTLTRYDGYAIAASQGARDSRAELLAAGASAALVADRVASCAFDYAPGTAERAGLLSVQLGIAEAGETVALLTQVHVENVP